MKRIAVLVIILLFILLFWRRYRSQPGAVIEPAQDCVQVAEGKVRDWKKAHRSDAEIQRLYQAEVARCNGVGGACAAFVGAVNVDYAFLGRQVLSGSLTPAEYLARVRDRSAKLKLARQGPEICDAYVRGDADGDLVPDEYDRCPNTSNLHPTGPDGCDSTAPLPAAPSAQAVADAAKALKVALAPACRNAPVPGGSTVLRAGLNPADEDSFLIEVTPVANQTEACPVFYEIEVRIAFSSFFSGAPRPDFIRRVFRAADAVRIPGLVNRTLVFPLRRNDSIPWTALVRSGVEPSDHARKYIRVRTVNGSGSSAGWSAARTREFRLNDTGFE